MKTINQLLLTLLLNACWQTAMISACAILCAWLLRGTSARYQHMLWVAALAISFALPVLTCAQLFRNAPGPTDKFVAPVLQSLTPSQAVPLAPDGSSVMGQADATGERSPADATVAMSSADTVEVSDTTSTFTINRSLAAGLVSLYLLFLFYRGVKFFRAWTRTKAIIASAHPHEPFDHVQTIVARCRASFGVVRARILYSTSVPVPITTGILNPLVILPEQLLQDPDTDLLTAAIGHELAHVWRRDYVLNLLYELIYLPISILPTAALVKRRINQTRELCCDELVAEKLLPAKVYARSLVQLAGSVPAACRLATTTTLGIADADILEVRVMTLLRRPKSTARRKNLLLLAASLLLAAPCLAAASFAFRLEIDPQDASTVEQQEAEAKAHQKKESELQRKDRAREERETREKRRLQESEVRLQEERGAKELERKELENGEKLLGQDSDVLLQEKRAQEDRAREAEELQLQESELLLQAERAQKDLLGQERESEDKLRVQESELRRQAERAQKDSLAQKRESEDKLRVQEAELKVQHEKMQKEWSRTGEAMEKWQTLQSEDRFQLKREGKWSVDQLEPKRQTLELLAGKDAVGTSQKATALARQAKIPMQQAIQIATSRQPGTVLQCGLGREKDEAVYHVVILTGDGTEGTITHVHVSAINGRVIRVRKSSNGSTK